MKSILIVPDKFKGTLTAREVSTAIEETLLEIEPDLHIDTLPLADGGEGTCELLTQYANGSTVRLTVRDPLFRPIESAYGLSQDGKTAFLEMATASGLQLLSQDEQNPSLTSTVGTGDLIRHALDRGVSEIIMGVGGSGTTDGGMGMADALGLVFRDRHGKKLQPIGGNMIKVDSLDLTDLHPRLNKVRFTVFCDVDNPLHGLNGAAHVFSPQKGADATMVEALDAGLRHYETVLRTTIGRDVNFPGAGAGGGLPATIRALATVDLSPGMDFIINFIRLEDKIASADLIITGEGRLDQQTMAGKVVKGVADMASRHGKPVVAVAGTSLLDDASVEQLSLAAVVTLAGQGVSKDEAMRNSDKILRRRIAEFWKTFILPGQASFG